MNDWIAFCDRCNAGGPEAIEICGGCGAPLRVICSGCGIGKDQGDHECRVVTIPANPLAVENEQLRAQLAEYRRYVANLGCERPVRHWAALDDKVFEPCGECLPCRSREGVEK